jgi:hypothetical protein
MNIDSARNKEGIKMKSKSAKQHPPIENDSFSSTTIAALVFLAARFPHRQFNSAELCILSGIGRTALSQGLSNSEQLYWSKRRGESWGEEFARASRSRACSLQP